MPFLITFCVWDPTPPPQNTHSQTRGLSCFRGIHLSLGIWVLLGHCLLRGKSTLFRWHLWSTVNWPPLSSFPHFFLFYTDSLFTLPSGTPPFPLLMFLHVSLVSSHSHPVCIFPILKGPVQIPPPPYLSYCYVATVSQLFHKTYVHYFSQSLVFFF